MTDVIREHGMFSDDARMIADMIKEQWSLGPQNEVNVMYEPEQLMTSARVGYVYVYPVSRSNQISSTDYQTLQRTSNLSVKVSNRFRETHFKWCEEIYRILLANRRRGQRCLHGWLFLEVTGDRQTSDLSGWYTTTINVRLTTYNKPIESAGFGDTVNNLIRDYTDNQES